MAASAPGMIPAPPTPVRVAATDFRAADQAQLRPETVPEPDSYAAVPWVPLEADGNRPAIGIAAQGAHLDLNPLFAAMDRPDPDLAGAGVASPRIYPPNERYHLGLMLWESLAFTGVEDTFRLFTDPYMRELVVDKPYWADYKASMGQWNMRRWNDGDDFLVDDIGHPMQGAISAFIEIQNSPRQRDLRIGKSKEYWRSRFLSMMWATVFSTQQKIGPLGEAALGSAGGYTYTQNCAYPCPSYIPGVTKYTNNTGWTDFITTPTIGQLSVMLEDFLDLEVSDRLQRNHIQAPFPKIVRGALNPSRTFANAMRWRKPWYRTSSTTSPTFPLPAALMFSRTTMRPFAARRG